MIITKRYVWCDELYRISDAALMRRVRAEPGAVDPPKVPIDYINSDTDTCLCVILPSLLTRPFGRCYDAADGLVPVTESDATREEETITYLHAVQTEGDLATEARRHSESPVEMKTANPETESNTRGTLFLHDTADPRQYVSTASFDIPVGKCKVIVILAPVPCAVGVLDEPNCQRPFTALDECAHKLKSVDNADKDHVYRAQDHRASIDRNYYLECLRTSIYSSLCIAAKHKPKAILIPPITEYAGIHTAHVVEKMVAAVFTPCIDRAGKLFEEACSVYIPDVET